MKNIAIFASGSGTNAENIIKYFSDNNHIKIKAVFSNKKDAFVLKRAENLKVPTYIFNKKDLSKSSVVLNKLQNLNIDYIILAGFLWLIPKKIVNNYKNKILNIHPAILPKYGGKGMYGDNVHKAVLENNEQKSGITIHYVNEKYDEGDIIFQDFCKINKNETIESLAKKIHKLEYIHYPKIIEKIINKSL